MAEENLKRQEWKDIPLCAMMFEGRNVKKFPFSCSAAEFGLLS